MTPVAIAAAKGHCDVVQLLHQHSASVCLRNDKNPPSRISLQLTLMDSSGAMALVHAAAGGHKATVNFLTHCGCELRHEMLQKAFVSAAAGGHTKVVNDEDKETLNDVSFRSCNNYSSCRTHRLLLTRPLMSHLHTILCVCMSSQ